MHAGGANIACKTVEFYPRDQCICAYLEAPSLTLLDEMRRKERAVCQVLGMKRERWEH